MATKCKRTPSQSLCFGKLHRQEIKTLKEYYDNGKTTIGTMTMERVSSQLSGHGLQYLLNLVTDWIQQQQPNKSWKHKVRVREEQTVRILDC
ncbi:hypothetical protein AKJ16_DCAP11987 [Drosera capensis]